MEGTPRERIIPQNAINSLPEIKNHTTTKALVKVTAFYTQILRAKNRNRIHFPLAEQEQAEPKKQSDQQNKTETGNRSTHITKAHFQTVH